MKRNSLIVLLMAFAIYPALGFRGPEKRSDALAIGSIDYFGYEGLNLAQFAGHLPIHVNDSLSLDAFHDEQKKIQVIARQFTGKRATDIAAVCCDAGHRLEIYIGLSGASSHVPALNSPPHGHEHLSDGAIQLYHQYLSVLADAVRRGAATEDDSNGYSLSNDPTLRDVELKMRTYSLSHAAVLERVLLDSSEAQQRRASACLLGYAERSAAQVRSLTEATRDDDEDVRNNALRALWVLASASRTEGIQIPATPFINLLFSGRWTDRNKSSLLLERLTRKGNPSLLRELRNRAMAPLIEGARWTDPGHCDAFLAILGRIGRIPENRLQKLILAGDKPQIIEAARRASTASACPPRHDKLEDRS